MRPPRGRPRTFSGYASSCFSDVLTLLSRDGVVMSDAWVAAVLDGAEGPEVLEAKQRAQEVRAEHGRSASDAYAAALSCAVDA